MPDTLEESPRSNDAEIETKFWKALKSDRTLMIGIVGVEDGIGQPMTAHASTHSTLSPA